MNEELRRRVLTRREMKDETFVSRKILSMSRSLIVVKTVYVMLLLRC